MVQTNAFRFRHVQAHDELGIDRVLRKLYASISGAEPDRRWHQFRALFHEGARISDGAFDEERPFGIGGTTVEQFIAVSRRHPDVLVYEEAQRSVHLLGELALVISEFVVHADDGRVSWRGVNWVHLRKHEGAWRIQSVVSRPVAPAAHRPPQRRLVARWELAPGLADGVATRSGRIGETVAVAKEGDRP